MEITIQVLKALVDALEKWTEIMRGEWKDEGPDNCPLCGIFRRPSNRGP